jgi:hypothetical protein
LVVAVVPLAGLVRVLVALVGLHTIKKDIRLALSLTILLWVPVE